MELLLLLGFVLFTSAAIGLVIYFGRKFATHTRTESPDSDLNVELTMTGTILYALLVGFWITCMISRTLSPESSFGSFMNRPIGLAATIVASIFVSAAMSVVLRKLGYPAFRRD